MSDSDLTEAEIIEANIISKTALEQPITSESEMAGVMKVMNEDVIEKDRKSVV